MCVCLSAYCQEQRHPLNCAAKHLPGQRSLYTRNTTPPQLKDSYRLILFCILLGAHTPFYTQNSSSETLQIGNQHFTLLNTFISLLQYMQTTPQNSGQILYIHQFTVHLSIILHDILFTPRCLSWLTNSALDQMRWVGGGCGVSANEYSCIQELI